MRKINWDKIKTRLDALLVVDEYLTDPSEDWLRLVIKTEEDYGLRLNTNGLWQINQGWLRNIRYVLQASYISKQGMTEAEETAANAVYSGTLIDRTTLSNRVGQHVYDANHQELTPKAKSAHNTGSAIYKENAFTQQPSPLLSKVFFKKRP